MAELPKNIVALPCEIGDRFYAVSSYYPREILEFTCEGFKIRQGKEGYLLYLLAHYDAPYLFWKSAFLTKDEAEQLRVKLNEEDADDKWMDRVCSMRARID